MRRARIVLTQTDFADLVEGRQVAKEVELVSSSEDIRVLVVLEDIGYPDMLRAVQIAARNASSDGCGV